MYTQNFTEEELIEMPSCNLVKSIHNKWLQASGNSGDDLYVSIVEGKAILRAVSGER